MNDRALRDIVIGLGGHREGVPRETGFDITAASEVMAILCLATTMRRSEGAPGPHRGRLSAPTAARCAPPTCKAVGAMAALLRDAIKPNLVQTMEGVPAFVHGGPFANIAHGTNSITATRLALRYADAVVTEAGFAFELGAEKFFDINCRYGGFAPSCTVLVATLRALKMHGGVPLARASRARRAGGRARAREPREAHREHPQVRAAVRGRDQPLPHRHGRGGRGGRTPLRRARGPGRGVAAVREGGEGCRALAEVVWAMARSPAALPAALRVERVDREEDPHRGARDVRRRGGRLPGARQARSRAAREARLRELPVCIAKTQQSLSDNPALLGRPKDFLVTVREIQLAAGAGFVVPITGEILRMPGLPAEPLAERFDLGDDGHIVIG